MEQQSSPDRPDGPSDMERRDAGDSGQIQTVSSIEKQEFLEKITASFHSGPLPDPETLRQYGDISEGFPERIIVTYEKEVQHRHRIERETRFWLPLVGQIFAFLLCLAALGISLYLAVNRQPIESIATVLIALGSLVGIFVLDRRSRRR